MKGGQEIEDPTSEPVCDGRIDLRRRDALTCRGGLGQSVDVIIVPERLPCPPSDRNIQQRVPVDLESDPPGTLPSGHKTTARIESITYEQLVLIAEDGTRLVDKRKTP